MNTKIKTTIALMFAFAISKAQTPIMIPDTLSGTSINLTLKDSSHQFYSGVNTATYGYNGSLLGPTIILNQGQQVTLNVKNQLNDTTTTHWHGLHVSPANDGSPHNMIMSGDTWSPSFTVLDKAATYWYHPHLHMKTMKQVLKGASGLIIVRDAEEAALLLPRSYGIDDFPLVCQWKTFDANTKQIVMDDELDNATMVNGNLNGYLNVPAQMVRLRLLNGSSHRFFNFSLNDGRIFKQIAGDESLLDAPVSMTSLTLAPGERAEIIVDFSGQVGKSFYLRQLGTKLPAGYPGGPPDQMGMGGQAGPLDNKDFNLLEFRVTAATASAITALPGKLTTNTIASAIGATTMTFLLQGSPMMSMTNFTINGGQYDESKINFTTEKEGVMVWDITNRSMMPHPWHIHGNHFYIQSINGAAPPANMKGRKDVVVVPPSNGTVKLIMKYADFADSKMPYMYHCHINSHEDKGMMGQFIVNSSIPTGIQAVENNAFQLSIYPNPANEEWIVTGNNLEQLLKVKLTNALGQIVYETIIKPNQTGISLSVRAANLGSGIYFLQIASASNSQTVKLIKN